MRGEYFLLNNFSRCTYDLFKYRCKQYLKYLFCSWITFSLCAVLANCYQTLPCAALDHDLPVTMADDREQRKRKHNFGIEKQLLITELFEKNKTILQSKLTNTITNKSKIEKWEEIAQFVTALGYAKRSKEEVRDKWKNMLSQAKKAFSASQASMRKTGGGPPEKGLSKTDEIIIDLFKDSASFCGISGGLETEVSIGEGTK